MQVRFFAAGVCLLTAGFGIEAVVAAPGELAQIPLEVSTRVAPNVMLLLDNSGSMNNIVADAPTPADNDPWSACETAVPENTEVFISIRRSDGSVGFRQSSSATSSITTWSPTGNAVSCFQPDRVYKAKLYANQSNTTHRYSDGSTYLAAGYSGHYLNWYFANAAGDGGAVFTGAAVQKPGTEQRMVVAKKAATTLLDSLSGVRVGLASYDASGGARILVPVADVNTQRDLLKQKIDAIVPSGSTPLAASFEALGRYFISGGEAQRLRLHPNQIPPGDEVAGSRIFARQPAFDSAIATSDRLSPIQYSCQQSFLVALTDGRPQSDQSVSSYLEDYDGDCADNSCGGHDRKVGRDYESAGSDYLDDVAQALYELDLRPDLLDNQGNPIRNNLRTYMIGFADTLVQNDPLIQEAARQGGGEYTSAERAQDLGEAFQKVINGILRQTGTAAKVAFNASELAEGSALYQTFFDSQRWGGDFKKFPLGADGWPGSESWSAADRLSRRTADQRVVLTWNGSQGRAFRWSELSEAQRADLRTGPAGNQEDLARGEARLAYLRGDRSQEGKLFRHRSSLLGDFVHSAPVYVGAPELDLPADELLANPFGNQGSRYRGFQEGAAGSRRPVVYAGANDGMLHGFDAESGEELVAYLPNRLFSTEIRQGLHWLTDPAYEHRYYVDLTPTVSDVYLAAGAQNAWRTVLAGGLGAGGRGVFLLDVTDPSQFSESRASDLVLWEFSDRDDPVMGYSVGQPVIGLLDNDRWAVILGNGYPDGSGQAKLLILYLEGGRDGVWTKGRDYLVMDTPASGAVNGLMAPAALDLDGNGTLDRVYAGDLAGNLWAFDLKGSDTQRWGIAHQQGKQEVPLFTAHSGGAAQPITVEPLVLRNSQVADSPAHQPNLLVAFGSGQYLANNDPQNTQTQSFYGIWDRGEGGRTRANLNALSLQASQGQRTVSGAATRWGVGQNNEGWYLDLDQTGERVLETPEVKGKSLLFNTLVPSNQACSGGGVSWRMAINALDGLAASKPVLDRNRDGRFDDSDLQESLVVVGLEHVDGLLARSGYLEDLQFTATLDGDLLVQRVNAGESYPTGRLSWQELLQGE